jgi:GINS complex subunit 4
MFRCVSTRFYNTPAIIIGHFHNKSKFNILTIDAGNDNLNTLVRDATRALIAERESPEILKFNKEVVDDLDKYICQQDSALEEVEANTVTENFFKSVYKLEVERMKFMLKSYLNTRLFKIEKYCLDLIFNERIDLLSESEYEFAAKFFIYKKKHYQSSFSKKLPNSLNDFVEPNDDAKNPNCPVNPEMVTLPNLSKPIFLKVTKSNFKLSHQDAGIHSNLKLGDVMFIPYNQCMDLLQSGVAELT